jgi:hypothetical protein
MNKSILIVIWLLLGFFVNAQPLPAEGTLNAEEISRMNSYANLNGNSGVAEYQISETSIRVKFITSPDSYVYTCRKPGKIHVDEMKRLAKSGRGLATYINQKVRKNYDHKE